ncbi:unnamed protein product [Clonostachys rosea]|uniref:JmjC domain-containing protein n=1 Tax=Bionectria ochroleuca TaxID=29856 RepID=A0ABY6UIK8_BIOOC|nr:unnamed protein product [Clonostachys rosea]
MGQLDNISNIFETALSNGAALRGVYKIRLPRNHPAYQHRTTEHRGQKACRRYSSKLHDSGLLMVSSQKTKRKFKSPEHNSISSRSVSTTPFVESSPPITAKELVSQQEERLRTNSLKGIYYRTDISLGSPQIRESLGLPKESPIHPLKENKLDATKHSIDGLHSPYCYESDTTPGAPFLAHIEDFDLCSVNILYHGRKIWISEFEARIRDVFPGASSCAQFMRHACLYVTTKLLDEWKIPFTIIDQQEGDIVVTLPNAYHQGFSVGYTKAEAINYADSSWDPEKTRNGCNSNCPGTPITLQCLVLRDEKKDFPLDAIAAASVCDPRRTAIIDAIGDGHPDFSSINKVHILQMIMQCSWPEPAITDARQNYSHVHSHNFNLHAFYLQTSRSLFIERVLLIQLAKAHEEVMESIRDNIKQRRKFHDRVRKEKRSEEKVQQPLDQENGPAGRGRGVYNLATEQMFCENSGKGINSMSPKEFIQHLNQGYNLMTLQENLGQHILVVIPIRNVEEEDLVLTVNKSGYRSQPIMATRFVPSFVYPLLPP